MYKFFCGYLNNNYRWSFVTDDEKTYKKYNKIWEVIRKLLKVNFAVSPVCDDKYLVAKLKIFAGIHRTTFINNSIPIEKNITFAFQQ